MAEASTSEAGVAADGRVCPTGPDEPRALMNGAGQPRMGQEADEDDLDPGNYTPTTIMVNNHSVYGNDPNHTARMTSDPLIMMNMIRDDPGENEAAWDAAADLPAEEEGTTTTDREGRPRVVRMMISTRTCRDVDRWRVMPNLVDAVTWTPPPPPTTSSADQQPASSSSMMIQTTTTTTWSPAESTGTLVALDLTKNRYMESLHESVLQFENIQILSLRQCSRLQSLPEGLGPWKNLREMDLTDVPELTHLPESIGDLVNLKRLLMGSVHSSGNKVLKRLPDSLGQLIHLEELVLDKCKELESLPDSIGGLQALVSLQMRECKSIKALPSSLGNCQALVEIGLSKCVQLKALPDTIGQLSNLEDLILAKCKRLRALPESVGQCQSLSWLDARNCKKLVTLPRSLGQITHLRQVDLSGCRKLKHLPPLSLSTLPDLERLDVTKCPALVTLPDEMMTWSTTLRYGRPVLVGWSPRPGLGYWLRWWKRPQKADSGVKDQQGAAET